VDPLQFSNEELLKSAQFMTNFWLLTTMAYLKQHEQPISDWVRYGGEHVARGFKGREHVRAYELARTIALHSVSLGGLLVYLEGNGKSAIASVHFPAEEMVNAFGLSMDEFDLFLGGVYEPLATSLGMKYASQCNGETWTWQISK
jgi:hypothetical protein